MSKKLVHLLRRAKPLAREEGMSILERDRFRCQYCGLDGLASFENSLMMTVDFVIPRALKGRKDPRNLVASCHTCNVLKGRHKFESFEAAKRYVLERREEERRKWQERASKFAGQKASA